MCYCRLIFVCKKWVCSVQIKTGAQQEKAQTAPASGIRRRDQSSYVYRPSCTAVSSYCGLILRNSANYTSLLIINTAMEFLEIAKSDNFYIKL